MANQPDDRIETILLNLVNLTRAGRLDWTAESLFKGGRSVGGYITSLTATSIAIWSKDGDGLAPIYLEISNSVGDPIEEIGTRKTANMLQSQLLQSRDVRNELLQDLYTTAKRKALNTDAILDQILEELNQRSAE